ncbi:MAG: Na/Pi cotransporter family protein [Deltaproteobacteria bacterium]|nr:Na/Pi cotransporter family protein [Deltaproteobacteria bacterium]
MILEILLATLGGLGLFLFGMHLMSDALQRIAGSKLRRILEKLTTNRVVAAMAGTAITAIIQSSSATTVMTVGLVNAGLMSVQQALGIVLGANIGTTVTAQIIAFKLADVALPLVGVGMFMKILSKREKVRYWGDFLLGFGLLFFGMLVMQEGVMPLRDAPWVTDIFVQFSRIPVLGVLVGAVMTMIFQSSSATAGLVIALASTGMVDFPGAAALVLGDNIGTTITANLAAIGTSVSAKRVARAHFLFNLFGVCIVLAIFPYFVQFVDLITPGDPMQVTATGVVPYAARHVANLHTLFNVTNCLLFLPFLGALGWVASFITPGEEKPKVFRLETLAPTIFETPSFALDEARQELDYMGGEVFKMLSVAEMPLLENKETEKSLEEIKKTEDIVDSLQKEINTYLAELSRNSITEKQSREVFSMLQIVSNLERIGDHCESIGKLCKRRNEFNLDFSEEGRKELSLIYHHTKMFLKTVVDAITDTPGDLMEQVQGFEPRLNAMRREMRINHMDRLKTYKCDADAGLIFIDLLTSFEKIGDHAYNIAESLSGLTLGGTRELRYAAV